MRLSILLPLLRWFSWRASFRVLSFLVCACKHKRHGGRAGRHTHETGGTFRSKVSSEYAVPWRSIKAEGISAKSRVFTSFSPSPFCWQLIQHKSSPPCCTVLDCNRLFASLLFTLSSFPLLCLSFPSLPASTSCHSFPSTSSLAPPCIFANICQSICNLSVFLFVVEMMQPSQG